MNAQEIKDRLESFGYPGGALAEAFTLQTLANIAVSLERIVKILDDLKELVKEAQLP